MMDINRRGKAKCGRIQGGEEMAEDRSGGSREAVRGEGGWEEEWQRVKGGVREGGEKEQTEEIALRGRGRGGGGAAKARREA